MSGRPHAETIAVLRSICVIAAVVECRRKGVEAPGSILAEQHRIARGMFRPDYLALERALDDAVAILSAKDDLAA